MFRSLSCALSGPMALDKKSNGLDNFAFAVSRKTTHYVFKQKSSRHYTVKESKCELNQMMKVESL